ncbi:lysine N(6)-hydroxylase/L-ornithine N(5)-oxygenase family protein [Micromonospora halophytica]|uniref:lysine N(6)-hydroxylase/L-ornithine N(5)-oxygenase family protein n=1 Tax=Micromonospora halophytica TaxID=47864 RepID=UPI000B854E73|nr:SidA/IucD/PvdA family monooxygenase [Micromonospora halophytica]
MREDIVQVAGVGFGPSNLALAIALRECRPAGTGAVFFERQPSFGWHSGMLLDDATMQISFLKDLVLLRNPVSSFSFLAYLHDRGRLADFINHQTLVPSRLEFHDYLRWAAERVGGVVRYDSEVLAIRPVSGDGVVDQLELVVRDGAHREPYVCRARNVVLATGLRPRLPDGVRASDRVWHSADYLHRLAGLPPEATGSFTVVGSGQSAAEITNDLMSRFPEATVHAVFPRYGYSVADDSPFTNRIFDAAAVDDYYLAAPPVRESLMNYHANTNYSVVDLDLIRALYRRQYQERVRGVDRLRIVNVSRVRQVRESGGGVSVDVEYLPTGERTDLRSDVVVFATGYRPLDPRPLLGELMEFVELDDDGMVRVGRDYRLCTSDKLTCGIYLQGGTEHTHGISSSLLSTTAQRAGHIVESLTASTPQ